MKRTTIVIAAVLAFGAALPTVPAQAQNTRSFVSGLGNDGNACTLAAPCRTFQHAHDQTNAGGEIAVLDSAGYGAVTITKAISIVNPGGVEAGIAVPSGGTGITINAGPNDIVALRGLTLEGAGLGQNGIVFNSGLRLEIIDSVVRNFALTGIFVQPTNASMELLISNTRVLDNPNSAGIDITPQAGGKIARATIDRVTVEHNNYGIYMGCSATNTYVNAAITNSVISSNLNTGLAVVGAGGCLGAVAQVKDSTLNSNPTGISGSGSVGGIIFLSHSMIVSSATGIDIGSNSSVFSAGNNDLYLNGTPISGGSLTPNPEQ
jgi:hypothetical protein